MSVATVNEFMNASIGKPGFIEGLAKAVAGCSPQDAGAVVAQLGAAEGYSFSAADALEFRQNALSGIDPALAERTAEDDILEGVRGGNGYYDPNLTQSGMSTGMPGGMVVGAAAGAAVDSAQNGGNFLENFANNLNNALNDAKDTVQSFFSGW